MVAVISEDRAAYRILAVQGFFGPDDHLYPEGSPIYFDAEPNLEMEPLNRPAREAMKTYIAKLDEEGQKVAEKNGRGYVGIARTLDEQVRLATEDARRPQLIAGDGGRPVMGGKTGGAKHIQAIVETETPQDGQRAGASKRGSMSV